MGPPLNGTPLGATVVGVDVGVLVGLLVGLGGSGVGARLGCVGGVVWVSRGVAGGEPRGL